MDSRSLDWEDVRLFLAVAEAKSVSGAARALGMSQPTVSRRLGDLEARLGVTLFERTLGGTLITATAERMLEPARRMADWAGEVSRAAAATDTRLSGVVRVTAPPLIAATLLTRFAAVLAEKHPGLRLESLATIRYLDLPRGEADLAIRARPSNQPELVTVATIEHRQYIYVARTIAERLGLSPALADIPWLAWAAPFQELPPNPQLARLIPGFAPAFTTDDPIVMLEAAEAGVGATVLADALHAMLRRTDLVPLQTDLGVFACGETHLVSSRSGLGIPRVKAVAELLRETLMAAATAGAR